MAARNRHSKLGEFEASQTGIALNAREVSHCRDWANSLGIPLAYLYADNSDLAEVILAFGLLPEREQRSLAMELKARVSPSTAKSRPARRASATRRAR